MKGAPLAAVFLGLGALTILCIVVGDGDVLVALTPALVATFLYAAWKLPLRWPLLATTFLAITLENPSDAPASGLWKSPLYDFGAVMLVHMNVTFPCKALFFSGLDVVLFYLFVVAAIRAVNRSRIDPPLPKGAWGPIGWFAALTIAGAVWVEAYGIARGGADVASSFWQIQRVVYLPLLVFLSLLAFRETRDAAALGKVIVAAACLKACVALYVRATVPPPPGEPILPYATSHPDSMLFAVAFCILLAMLVHGVGRRRMLLAVVVLPLLIAGMVANNRRLVWVQVAVGIAVLATVTPWSSAKRRFVRGCIAASPLFLAYLAAGWNSDTGIFKPVHTIRSVVDSKADPSTMWRDLENYNLFVTLRHNAVFGTGYGHGYDEIISLPDISSAYTLYRFLPHNSVLGLWAYAGLVGFTALWTIFVVGLFLAARAYRYSRAPLDRTVTIVAILTIVIYLTYCYGDLGLGTWVGVFTVGPALAFASRLAVISGGWPAAAQAPAPAAERVPEVDAASGPSAAWGLIESAER
jgi:O-antigen ligase